MFREINLSPSSGFPQLFDSLTETDGNTACHPFSISVFSNGKSLYAWIPMIAVLIVAVFLVVGLLMKANAKPDPYVAKTQEFYRQAGAIWDDSDLEHRIMILRSLGFGEPHEFFRRSIPQTFAKLHPDVQYQLVGSIMLIKAKAQLGEL